MSMRRYLIKHGEAKSEVEDPEHSLTIRGGDGTRKISDVVKRLDIHLSRIKAVRFCPNPSWFFQRAKG